MKTPTKKKTSKPGAKRGRKPGTKLVEKRTEMALLGQPDVVEATNTRNGRPKKTYEERPEHIQFIIDCLAVGYSATHVVKLLKDKYGEDADQVVSVSTIREYARRHFDIIEERRKILHSELPILSPNARMRYLQDVADKGLMGVDMYTQTGMKYVKYDLNIVVKAVQEMNAMQGHLDKMKPEAEAERRVIMEDEEKKRLIREYIEEMKLKNVGMNEQQLFERLRETADAEYSDVFEQLSSEYKQ